MKSWKLYLLIILLSLFPLIAIFLTPNLPHTSDGAMHTVRFAEYYKEIAAGQFPVRWASQFDYGYGTPIFVFFDPLPYMVGALFVALGMPLIMTLKVSFALTYILAGIFMLMFARSYFKDIKTAFFVTIMYQYAPFRLVEMLVRGSVGSLYAYMVLPLVFYAITKFIATKKYRYFIILAVFTALLPLSHNIVGFVFFGISFLYVPFATRKIKEILSLYFSMGLGLALSAFFIIPAILEHKYTNGYLFTKDLFWNQFPRLFTFFLPNITDAKQLRINEVSVQIGLFHVLAFALVLYFLLRKKLQIKTRMLAVYLLIISLITMLFMQPVTKVFWIHIPFIREFQFPWRLLAIICFTSSVASSFAIEKIAFLRKTPVYVVLIFLVIISTIFYWVPYEGYQKFPESYFWNFPGSTNYFGEVNTIWMAHEPLQFPKNRIEVISGTAAIANIKILPEYHSFSVNAKNEVGIVDRTYFYPGWKVLVDNQPTTVQFQDQNYRGLITFAVTPGMHQITVAYSENQIQKLSDYISIITILLLLAGVFIYPRLHIYEARKE